MKNIAFALIGGGPASFYTARLLAKLPCNPQIHIIEKQLCPFGLIRYGVAPDHISIKRVESTLSESVQKNPNFHLFGNKQIKQEDISTLKQMYSGIVYAYGASGDYSTKLKSNGKIHHNIKVARQFVYWYNGHPSYEQHHYDLSKVKNVAIIGNGNVAIDIARIFLRDPDELEKTEISPSALKDLRGSRIRNVQILGRRGITHSAYSLKEVRELHRLGIKLYAINEQLQSSLNDASHQQITALGVNLASIVRMNRRKINFMKQSFTLINEKQIDKVLDEPHPKIIFRYLLSPDEVSSSSTQLTCIRNTLTGQAFGQKAVSTTQKTMIPYDLLINSIGFEVKPLDKLISLEKTQLMKIEGGYVSNPNKNQMNNSHGCIIRNDKISIGQYAVGWCKNGAKGVIDETFLTAEETFNNIRIHYQNGLLEPKSIGDQQELRKTGGFFENSYSLEQYIEVREKQFDKGSKAKWIRKKLGSKEIKQLYKII